MMLEFLISCIQSEVKTYSGHLHLYKHLLHRCDQNISLGAAVFQHYIVETHAIVYDEHTHVTPSPNICGNDHQSPVTYTHQPAIIHPHTFPRLHQSYYHHTPRSDRRRLLASTPRPRTIRTLASISERHVVCRWASSREPPSGPRSTSSSLSP